MEGILYVLKTGIPWRALPRCFDPATTLHDRFQEWTKAGVFDRLWERCLLIYDENVEIEWTWQSMDGVMTKAPFAGRRRAPIRRIEPRAGPSGASSPTVQESHSPS